MPSIKGQKYRVIKEINGFKNGDVVVPIFDSGVAICWCVKASEYVANKGFTYYAENGISVYAMRHCDDETNELEVMESEDK